MSNKDQEIKEEAPVAIEDLSNPVVVDSYNAAGIIANNAIKHVISKCVVGALVVDICQYGDDFIEAEAAKTFTKRKNLEKGIAFPTCVSVNNCVGHFSPLKGNTRTLKQGDVVKIDLGCHIDGYIAVGAHTIIIGNTSAESMTGKVADAICAAHYALEAALRMIRPGKTSNEVTQVIEKISDMYGVTSVSGILSHELKRFIIDGEKVIFSKNEPSQKIQTYEFQENEVYCIDIVMSTGEGKAREEADRPTIYRRNLDSTYKLKSKASRDFKDQIVKRYSALPFPLRNFDEKVSKLGLVELVEHQVLAAYPVLFDRSGCEVVQFKTTVLVLPNGNHKLIGTEFPLPFVRSEFSVTDDAIKALIASPLKINKKAAKKASATTIDVKMQ
ncbi:proliferation associated protein [Dictyostelium discoideum AX4]|uniref:Proliferation-associated protein A n=1 Tax=Dictyostelium discoideum TaxID=44689 RepID=PRLA_DICDI|nr:proliferation associated protein [Dictyostelium discoideum AX4]Q1ZXG4.1 RecName: Full=Proliferation-associated protein A [Dictyostelium discoideum]EAS66866.1 proliferation associated protein [Dictyostelium discoideum AX4]|eukprot:XP_001134549.1 proliferation associated protein [Dictyostelium discoideum AX4]